MNGLPVTPGAWRPVSKPGWLHSHTTHSKPGARFNQLQGGAVPRSAAPSGLVSAREVPPGSPFHCHLASSSVWVSRCFSLKSRCNPSGSISSRACRSGRVDSLIVPRCGHISFPVYGVLIFYTLQGFLERVAFSEHKEARLGL